MAVQRARRNADALNELWGECVIAKIRPESVPPLDDPNPNPERQQRPGELVTLGRS